MVADAQPCFVKPQACAGVLQDVSPDHLDSSPPRKTRIQSPSRQQAHSDKVGGTRTVLPWLNDFIEILSEILILGLLFCICYNALEVSPTRSTAAGTVSPQWYFGSVLGIQAKPTVAIYPMRRRRRRGSRSEHCKFFATPSSPTSHCGGRFCPRLFSDIVGHWSAVILPGPPNHKCKVAENREPSVGEQSICEQYVFAVRLCACAVRGCRCPAAC